MDGSIALLTVLGLSAGLSALAGGGLRLLTGRAPAPPAAFDGRADGAPLASALAFRGLRHTDFTASQDQGNFGEALTLMAMAARGWRVINGKVGGPQGVDGVFVRDGEAGLEAVLIETKTGSSRYAEASMSDAKLLGDLDTLYVTAPDAAHQAIYAAIAAGLKSASPRIRKELWRHGLDTGRTQATLLGRDGERLAKGRLMDLRTFAEALTCALREFDRTSVYFTRP
ncbi:hypothetical protein ACWCOP_14105 [Maricaulaceae bacterium MS644]